MDQEIAYVLRKKPTILPVGSTSDVNKMKMGKIDPMLNSVMFTKEDGKKCLFTLTDKHLFTTLCLEYVLGIIHRCKQNSESDKKYFTDMIRWYIHFRHVLLVVIPCLFKVVNELQSINRSEGLAPIDAKGEIVGIGVLRLGLVSY